MIRFKKNILLFVVPYWVVPMFYLLFKCIVQGGWDKEWQIEIFVSLHYKFLKLKLLKSVFFARACVNMLRIGRRVSS